MDVNIYGGELNCDDVRRKFARKEIGVLGEFGNYIYGSILTFRSETFLFIFCSGTFLSGLSWNFRRVCKLYKAVSTIRTEALIYIL